MLNTYMAPTNTELIKRVANSNNQNALRELQLRLFRISGVVMSPHELKRRVKEAHHTIQRAERAIRAAHHGSNEVNAAYTLMSMKRKR